MLARCLGWITMLAIIVIVGLPGVTADAEECQLLAVNRVITLPYFETAGAGAMEIDNCTFYGEWGYTGSNGDGTYTYSFNGVWFVLEA